MTLKIQSIDDLDKDAVQQNHQFLAELMQEEHPTLDLKRGPVFDLVTYLGSVLGTMNQVNLDRVRRSSSLLAITEDPTLAEDDVVDRVLSNFRVTRREGNQAIGSLTIVVSVLAPVTIGTGAIFEAAGKRFVAESAFAARTSSANVQSSTDRILTPMDDGNYAFTITVIAEEVGDDSRLVKDMAAVPDIEPPNFVKAFATDDFSDGESTETNADLLQRFQEGVAAKALSGRVMMAATLRAYSQFEAIVDQMIIGFGDAEMLRDQHTIWPGSLGGRVDWYVRTVKQVQLIALTKTATLVEKTSDGFGIWQIAIGRDDAPGFYDVTGINQTTSTDIVGSYEIVEEVRGINLTAADDDDFVPDIANVVEGAYSRYQTTVIKFEDTDTGTGSLTINSSTRDYAVTVRGIQQISDMQDELGSRGVRNYAGDVLIKAPVPCFLRLSLTVQLKPGQLSPDLDAIKSDLADVVNTYGFTGRLPASALSDTIHNHLEGVAAISAIDMFGKMRYPDGTIKFLRSTEVLIVPDEPEEMVTARTVAFYLNVEDIAISVETVAIPSD